MNISEAAQVSPEMCYAEGEGVKECIRYRRSTFSVFLRDEKNNPISKGNLSVFMKGTTEFQYSMANAGNGSYWVRYKTTAEPGEYKLFVTVDGQQIRGSPFFVTIEPGREEDETSLNAGFPRLLRISTSGKTVLSTLVPLSGSSLNSDDVFLLDNELTIFQWNSPNSSRVLKLSAGQIVKVLNYDRRSALVHHIIEHKEHLASLDSSSHHGEKELQLFFELLNEDSNEWTNPNKRFVGDSKEEGFLPKIYSVDDQENLELLVEGGGIKADLFRPDKLLILDTGFEIFSWEGRNCPNNLKRYAFQAGKDYVKQFKRPEGIIVTHILEGSEKWTMKHFMNQENHL
uniref:Gelsolin-like domain-containing protein n=1 Tax=Arcella intermedia TaxID=1963864 RepID=A0A6B2L8M9_9EUKA